MRNNYDYKKLCPFKWFVLQNFPFIEADFDAITNWQLFCKLGEEMNKVIDKVNDSGEQVENLTTAFNNLYDYVSNFFDNLDVQDEINNKLDEMVDDGTLQNILNNYANIERIYNTTEEMLADYANIVENQKIKTLGYYNINDGGGAVFTVVDSVDANNPQLSLDNNLYATIISNYLTPEMFGAKGDGVTDDSNAFTECFKFTKPVICKSDAIYGITHVDFANHNIYLDGKGCTFKNIDLDMTEWSSGSASFKGISSMFADDVQTITDESVPYQHAYFKNFTVDQDCYNVVGLSEMHWGGLFTPFLLWNCYDIYIENVKAINTIQTPFHLYGAKNVFITNSYFENIGKNPYIGVSGRNIVNVPSITNPHYPIVEIDNITGINVNDEVIRADNCKSVKISNSTFEKVSGTIIEAHSSADTLPKLAPYRELNISNCTLNECKGIFHINALDDSPKTTVTVTNTINNNTYNSETQTYFGYMFAKGNNDIKISNSFFECPHSRYTQGYAHFNGITKVDFENCNIIGTLCDILIRCDATNILKFVNCKLFALQNILRFTSSSNEGYVDFINCDITATFITTGYVKKFRLINSIINLTYNNTYGYPIQFTSTHGTLEIINTDVYFDASELEISSRMFIYLASGTLDYLTVNGLNINCDIPLRVEFLPVLKKILFMNNFLSHDSQAFTGTRALQDGCVSIFLNNTALSNVGTNFVITGTPTVNENNYHFQFNE